jgi:ADP-ribosyl-[dinitrogen reductase] hydrolase
LAPGKDDPHSPGGAWARDLAPDLDAIVASGAATLTTLIEDHEFRLLSIVDLSVEAEPRGVEWLWLPIRDVSVPCPAFEATSPGHSAHLRGRLAAGADIVVHCHGDLGRAGMFATRLLVETGVDPDEAMARVRAVRPGAIETKAQEQWVGHGRRSSSASSAKVLTQRYS